MPQFRINKKMNMFSKRDEIFRENTDSITKYDFIPVHLHQCLHVVTSGILNTHTHRSLTLPISWFINSDSCQKAVTRRRMSQAGDDEQLQLLPGAHHWETLYFICLSGLRPQSWKKNNLICHTLTLVLEYVRIHTIFLRHTAAFRMNPHFLSDIL